MKNDDTLSNTNQVTLEVIFKKLTDLDEKMANMDKGLDEKIITMGKNLNKKLDKKNLVLEKKMNSNIKELGGSISSTIKQLEYDIDYVVKRLNDRIYNQEQNTSVNYKRKAKSVKEPDTSGFTSYNKKASHPSLK